MNSTKKLSTLLVGALFLAGTLALPADAQQGPANGSGAQSREARKAGPGDGTGAGPRGSTGSNGGSSGSGQRRSGGARGGRG
jgi:hypothetical protein